MSVIQLLMFMNFAGYFLGENHWDLHHFWRIWMFTWIFICAVLDIHLLAFGFGLDIRCNTTARTVNRICSFFYRNKTIYLTWFFNPRVSQQIVWYFHLYVRPELLSICISSMAISEHCRGVRIKVIEEDDMASHVFVLTETISLFTRITRNVNISEKSCLSLLNRVWSITKY